MPDYSDIDMEIRPGPSRPRKHPSLGRLELIKHAASTMQKSSQLTKHQQRLLSGCLDLVNGKSMDPTRRAHGAKIYRISRVRGLLRAVYSRIGFEACLLCALSLGITKIGCMTDAEATDFPFALQSWWEKTSPPLSQLTQIAKELKVHERRIANLPITNDMGESSLHIKV